MCLFVCCLFNGLLYFRDVNGCHLRDVRIYLKNEALYIKKEENKRKK